MRLLKWIRCWVEWHKRPPKSYGAEFFCVDCGRFVINKWESDV